MSPQRLESRQHRTYGMLALFPFVVILGAVPFQAWSPLADRYAVILDIFQRNDRVSTWLAFALVWVACAIAALASACLVFSVAQTRKRILDRWLSTPFHKYDDAY
jgi:Na+/H+ antiporter NhaC